MSDYTKTVDFAAKDALLTGNPSKLVKGTEIDTEFNNIATAIATKIEINGSASQTFSVAAATAVAHAVRADQIQGQSLTAFTTGGTSTAFTLTPTPAITAYTAGQRFFVTFSAACGASPTLQISGVATPPNLVRQNVDGTYSNLASNAFPSGWKSPCVAVSASQVLVEKLPPRATTLTTTHDLSLATGTKVISGAGFKGRIARFRMDVFGTAAFSIGSRLGSVDQCIFSNQGGTAGIFGNSGTKSGVLTVSSGNYVEFVVSSFDADGVTISFTKTGSPTGTAEIAVELEE